MVQNKNITTKQNEINLLQSADLSAIQSEIKEKKIKHQINIAMKNSDVKQAVLDFIFSNDPNAKSPLDKYRK